MRPSDGKVYHTQIPSNPACDEMWEIGASVALMVLLGIVTLYLMLFILRKRFPGGVNRSNVERFFILVLVSILVTFLVMAVTFSLSLAIFYPAIGLGVFDITPFWQALAVGTVAIIVATLSVLIWVRQRIDEEGL